MNIVGIKSIQIVEDDQMKLQFVGVLLAGEGHDLLVSKCRSVSKSLNYIQPQSDSLDVQLPGKSRLELT